MVLDIHPDPFNSQIEVVNDGEPISIGEMDESVLIGVIHEARGVLDSTAQDGSFVFEAEEKFTSEYRYEDVDEWLKSVEEGWPRARLDPKVVDRARELMSGGRSVLIMREAVRAARFRRP